MGDSNLQLVCFSHLRWNFVYQRPQHLLSRAAKLVPVHFWEEPVFEAVKTPAIRRADSEGVHVVTPVLPHGTTGSRVIAAQRELLNAYLADNMIADYIAWYYTPMALLFSDHLAPQVTVYDCMDELTAFAGAPPELLAQERRLFGRADVVFAGGASLYQSKREQHENVWLFPSSVDRAHFAAARAVMPEPPDQRSIPHPRIGFYGVLDERLDRELLAGVARLHPEWHLVLVGPICKITDDELPHADNIHYFGGKTYAELPQYLAGWDVAMLPFARNASTRFISPTKTPEYLAGGKPVVSTPIQDVVKPYGEIGLVRIGESAEEFAAGITAALNAPASDAWLEEIDAFLSENSWDKTFDGMWRHIEMCLPDEGTHSAGNTDQLSEETGQCLTI